MKGSPTDALFTRENMQELLEATRTHGSDCTEVLAYLALIAIRQILQRAIAEMDNASNHP